MRFWKKKRVKFGGKNNRITAKKISKFDEKHQFTHPRSTTNLIQLKYKENYVWEHHSQTAENQLKRKSLKQPDNKRTHYI